MILYHANPAAAVAALTRRLTAYGIQHTVSGHVVTVTTPTQTIVYRVRRI